VDGWVQLAEVVNPPSRGRNIAFDVLLADGVLEVENLTGQLYDGSLSGGFSLDLRPQVPPYPLRYAIQLRGAQSSHFLSRWTRLASAISGTVDFDIDGVAALDDGLLPQVDALTASGNSNFKDGQFQEFGPARALAERLQLQGPERLTFKQLGGIFKIERGALAVDNWSYRGTDVSGAINGSAGLNGGLDLTLSLEVPPAVLAQAGLLQGGSALATLSRQLAGADQTLDLTIGVGGTVTAPVLRVDTEELRKELESRLAGEGRGMLDRIFKPRAAPPAPSP
jgi:hypothetical protein